MTRKALASTSIPEAYASSGGCFRRISHMGGSAPFRVTGTRSNKTSFRNAFRKMAFTLNITQRDRWGCARGQFVADNIVDIGFS
ncbi:hypothetical protein PSAB6_50084 [Paraburkholderia sabiae]|nr:hypothetical protein PSAB6_50084 [Paraburkholderia sabiae]